MRTTSIALLLIILLTLSVNATAYSQYSSSMSITVYAPAVSSEGGGILSRVVLTVAYPGSGKVFFSATPLTELDTQASARVAALVASSISGANYFSYDYFVEMESNTAIIGGPSAGALMTVGFISLLLNITLSPGVTMTGMINPDGSIGPVGGLREKIEASAGAGFKVFLIPFGQRIYTEQVVETQKLPWGTIRRTIYRQIDLVDYGSKLGVKVVEVKTVREALTYFTNGYTVDCSANILDLPTGLLTSLKAHAEGMVSLSRRNLEQANESLSKVSYAYRSIVREAVLSASKLVNQAEDLLSNNYTLLGVNVAFRALYASTYVLWLAEVYSNERTISELSDLVNSTLVKLYEEISQQSHDRYISYSAIELLAGAKVRFNDAQESFSKSLNSTDTTAAINYLSYSYARAYTVELWMNLSTVFQEWRGELIDASSLLTLATMLYAMADSVVSYAQTLVSDLGVSAPDYEVAQDHISRAANSLAAGDAIGILGESIYASAYGITAIHTLFSVSEEVDRELARAVGGEALFSLCSTNFSSLMAIYYYYYGVEAEDNEAIDDALVSYVMSILYSKAALTLSKVPQSIQLTNVPPQGTPSGPSKYPEEGLANLWYLKMLASFAAGLAVGLTAMYLLRSSRSVKEQQSIEVK
ncbi:MAG: S16 family serine protease [Desulfurococcaceae archaeon]